MSELKAYEVYPVVGDNRKIVGSALHDDTEISLYRAQVYLKSEADKVIAGLEESHKNEVGQLLIEIAELKEERRWRKFPDEKPSEEMEGEDFYVSNGYYSVVCEWRGYWNNDPFCGDKNCDVVKCWMPLPAAPKES